MPAGSALSCLLIRQADQSWEASDLRFLGGSNAFVKGTEEHTTRGGRKPKIAESLAQQMVTDCQRLAKDLEAAAGIRIFGVLASDGQVVPEEVHAFIGSQQTEKLSTEQLQNFIIASLKARHAEAPDPAYQSLITTLLDAESDAVALPEEIVPVEEKIEEIPPPVVDSPKVMEQEVIAADVPEPIEVVEPIVNKIEENLEPPQPEVVAPPIAENVETKVLYEHEFEKMNKEKESTLSSAIPSSEPDTNRRNTNKLGLLWLNMKAFFTSMVFLRNVGAMVLFLGLIFLLTNFAMRMYTRHGDSMQLEDYNGILLEEAERRAAAKGLKLKVMDTSFKPKARPNEIISQYPAPFSKVKEDRTVFVVITQNKGVNVTLPSLAEVGDDFDTYRRELRRQKIDLIMKDQSFNGKLAEGTILYLIVNGEKITDTQLKKGDVVVEQGKEVEAVISTRSSGVLPFPDIICLSYDAARFKLTANNLIVGKVIGGTQSNRSNYYVYKTVPAYRSGKMIDKGSQIDLYLTATKPDGCD